jgi:poly(3-hydroxybutyrate) depolymerase
MPRLALALPLPPAVAVSTVLALALVACDSSPSSVDADLPDAPARDGGVDAELPSPRPVAPFFEPERLQLEWWSGYLASGDDPVLPAIEQGTFTVPTREGMRELDWVRWDPGESGEFEPFRGGIVWAAAQLNVPEGRNVIVRTERALTVHLGTQRQPGDPYASGRIRVPLIAGRGDALAIRLLPGRGAPIVQLWTTPDELWMNTHDLTLPDVVVGEAEEQWIGVPILNLTDHPAIDATARVVGDDRFEETTTRHPSLPAGAVTQVAFRLVPRAPFEAPSDAVRVRLRIESDSMRWSYEREVTLRVVARATPYRRTFRSGIDESAQFYGVRPPPDHDRSSPKALVLSLHGAGVDALAQAQSYSARDWAWLAAATNRRPFGFDWEVWGRLDGLEVLEHAQRSFTIDPTRVYVTGHSMGGHGTWQFGVLFPGRFAVVGPSAGWSSFYTYVGRPRPGGVFARSMASSDTHAYVSNLARRAVYVIHGSADDNVPVRESRDMVALLRPIVADLTYHEEPGAGHWWDGENAPGVDCVDWVPLFETMERTRLDPTELEFDFRSPSPSVSARHSYVTIRSATDPLDDVRVVSSMGPGEGELTLATTNVRSLVLDGDALAARAVKRIIVDGTAVTVRAGPIPVGPQEGKHPEVYGPFNQVFHRPFCLVYANDAPQVEIDYAAYLASSWQVYGNGSACALPAHQVRPALRAERNLVWIGAWPSSGWAGTNPFVWNEGAGSF